MGIVQDRLFGYLKDRKESAVEVEQVDEGLLKYFSFTSLAGGNGSTFLIQYLAQYLAKEEEAQVCVVDFDFTEPDLLYQFDVDVTEENSILNYLKGFKPLKSCYIPDKSIENLHLITMSPKDSLMMMMSLEDGRPFDFMLKELEVFDYVLINLPYEPMTLAFNHAMEHVDRGYMVADERLSATKRAEQVLNYLGKFHGNKGLMNRVILNKRSAGEYPYENFEEVGAYVVAELGEDGRLVDYMNEMTPLYKRELADRVVEGLEDVLKDISK